MLTACLLTLFVTHSLSTPIQPRAEAALATGPAGCAVQVGERVLMVRDIWSRRWGLPGGGYDLGETARQTAERETYEETGLRVVAEELLWTSPGNFAVYRCAPVGSGITMHTNGVLVLPKTGYDELIEARLLNLREVPQADLRYPSQRAPLLDAMRTAGLPESVLRAPPPWGHLFVDELPLIAGLQAGVSTIFGKHSDVAMRALSQLGSTAGIMLVIVGVWFLVGWRAGVELAYALLLTCLLSLIAKQVFGWPRPFHLDPALQRDAASSFGFPSAHTVCAAMLWGLVAQHIRWPGRWWACTILVLGCAVSGVALGVHFIHDVVAGSLLGAGACWAYHAHRCYRDRSQVPLRTWRLAALALGPVALIMHPQPSTVATCAALLGFTCGSWGLEQRAGGTAAQPSHWRLQTGSRRRLVGAGTAWALALGILYGAPLLVPLESSFLPYLYVQVLTYASLGVTPAAVDAAIRGLRYLMPAAAIPQIDSKL